MSEAKQVEAATDKNKPSAILRRKLGTAETVISEISEAIKKCFIDRTMMYSDFQTIAQLWQRNLVDRIGWSDEEFSSVNKLSATAEQVPEWIMKAAETFWLDAHRVTVQDMANHFASHAPDTKAYDAAVEGLIHSAEWVAAFGKADKEKIPLPWSKSTLDFLLQKLSDSLAALRAAKESR